MLVTVFVRERFRWRSRVRRGQAEIIKTFSEHCPEVSLTNNAGMANYAVALDHEGGKGLIWKDTANAENKMIAFS